MVDFLISYPRSGNTWLRYCIEYLSKHPTTSLLIDDAIKSDFIKTDAIGMDGLIDIDTTKPAILVKRHHLYETWLNEQRLICECVRCKYKVTHQDSIVFLVRDFKESVFRHILPQLQTMQDSHMLDNLNRYMSLVYFYDQHKGRKIIIYYEDLIINPIAELKKVCSFLDIDTVHLQSLADNLDYHKQKALNKYGDSKTGGDKLSYHANNVESRLVDLMSETLNSRHSEMLNKYLSRYKSA